MRVCVYGAGAIGGHAAVRLVAARIAEVSVVARGSHLAAIRARGLTLCRGRRPTTVTPAAATDDPAHLPPQDLVIATLKAYAVPDEAERIARLLAPGAPALFVLNGIPWWWHYGLPDAAGGALPLLDPEAALWTRLGAKRALGCVVYSSNTVTAPGVITHDGGNEWLIGEPDGSDSRRAKDVAALFNRAGLGAAVSRDLRRDIWHKLVLNAGFNPLCALTRRSTAGVTADRELATTARRIIEETLAVAAALGWDIRDEVDAAAVVRSGGDWRPSMLQDIDRGRPIEVEAILGQVHEFARHVGVPTPAIDSVLPRLRALDRALRDGA